MIFKKIFSAPLLFTIGFIAVAKLPIRDLYARWGMGEYTLLFNVITKAIIILLITIWIAKKFELFTYSGFKNHIWKHHWLLTLPLTYPGLLTYSKLNSDCLAWLALLSSFTTLIQAVLEEMVFRGIMQGYMCKYTNWSWYKISLTGSILFAVGHFVNLTEMHIAGVLNQVVYAFFMGLLFSAIQFRINNVWLLGIIHGILNITFTGCGSGKGIIEESEPGVLDYLVNFGSLVLVFSPILLMYFPIMGSIKNKKH